MTRSTEKIFLLFLVLLLVLPVQLSGQAISDDPVYSIAVFTPTTEGNTYWPDVHRIMNAAADDLGIELEFYEFDVADRFAKVESGVERMKTEPLPDAAIFSVAFGQARPLMEAAEQAGVPFYLHGPLFPEKLSEIGLAPQQEYRNWIGYFSEDEETKGYLLAQELIAAARSSADANASDPILVAGINGDRSWYGSILREAGLRRAVEEHPDVQLLQMVYTRWTPEEGSTMAHQLLRRYPNISVLWAASDQLAIGAAQALKDRRIVHNTAVFSGGLDLSDAGLTAVLQGELTATVASTQLIWAQVIVDLYDHVRGINMNDSTGSEIAFPPVVATRTTAEQIRDRIGAYHEIDFRRFSRFYHGSAARRLSDIWGDL